MHIDEPRRPAADGVDTSQRRTRVTPGDGRRAAVTRYMVRHQMDGFHQMLSALAAAVFGPQSTVVPHLRTVSGRKRLTFVVDAADPTACVDYAEFLPREKAFWGMYSQLPKPSDVPFLVAVRPARGWCRSEALAPLFAILSTPDWHA